MTWINPDHVDEAVFNPEAPLEPDETEEPDTRRQEYADGLRELAAFVESMPFDMDNFFPLRVNLFAWSKEGFDEKAKQIGGIREKRLEGSYAIVRRSFGPHSVDINLNREKICEKVEVGTKVVPAQEAVEEHEEPVYEWQCEGFTVIG